MVRREVRSQGLDSLQYAAVGKFGFKRLSVTLRHRGAIVGGLSADTYLGWMFIALFWVDEKFRGQGFGSKIMRTAEKEARRRGVKNVYVDTFSFQAHGISTRSLDTGSWSPQGISGWPHAHLLSKAL